MPTAPNTGSIPELPGPNRPGHGLLPDQPGYMPPSNQVIPNNPENQGTIDRQDNSKFMQWLKDEWQALKNFKFSMAGGGNIIEKLMNLFLKGYTGYELYKALNEDPDVPQTGGPSGGGGKKGGGGGGGKGTYTGPSGVGVYQGLNYKPSFLAWQPTNAGAPVFSGGGPSSLRGTPPTPPPPPVKKKKKGA